MTRDTFSEDAGAAMGAEVVGAVPEAGMLGRLIEKPAMFLPSASCSQRSYCLWKYSCDTC